MMDRKRKFPSGREVTKRKVNRMDRFIRFQLHNPDIGDDYEFDVNEPNSIKSCLVNPNVEIVDTLLTLLSRRMQKLKSKKNEKQNNKAIPKSVQSHQVSETNIDFNTETGGCGIFDQPEKSPTFSAENYIDDVQEGESETERSEETINTEAMNSESDYVHVHTIGIRRGDTTDNTENDRDIPKTPKTVSAFAYLTQRRLNSKKRQTSDNKDMKTMKLHEMKQKSLSQKCKHSKQIARNKLMNKCMKNNTHGKPLYPYGRFNKSEKKNNYRDYVWLYNDDTMINNETPSVSVSKLPSFLQRGFESLDEQQFIYFLNHYRKYMKNKLREWQDKSKCGYITMPWVNYRSRAVKSYTPPTEWRHLLDSTWEESKITETLNYSADAQGQELRETAWHNIVKEAQTRLNKNSEDSCEPVNDVRPEETVTCENTKEATGDTIIQIDSSDSDEGAYAAELAMAARLCLDGIKTGMKTDSMAASKDVTMVPNGGEIVSGITASGNNMAEGASSNTQIADSKISTNEIYVNNSALSTAKNVISAGSADTSAEAEHELLAEERSKQATSTSNANGVDKCSDVRVIRSTGDKEANDKPRIRAIPVENGVLIFTRLSQVVLKGRTRLNVLWGNVTILGYHMTPKSSPIDVVSPNSHAYLTISNETPEKPLTKFLINGFLPPHDIPYWLKHKDGFHDMKAVYLFTKLQSHVCDLLSSEQRYSDSFTLDGPKSDANKILAKSNVDVRVYETRDRDDFLVTSEFGEVAQKWDSILADKDEKHASIMVCGGKNSGKSTLTRYFLNSTLNKLESVCYLDLDVGQTEFSPPGCISLHLVNKPIFGPPFSHQNNTKYACYYGSVTPGNDPHFYIECIRTIYDLYLTLEPRPPLIINTLGWNIGLGFRLLIDIFHIIHPRVVTQLVCASVADNFPDLIPRCITTSHGWTYNTDFESENKIHGQEFTHDVVIVKSMAPARHHYYVESTVLRPKDFRDMSTLANFVPALGGGYHRSLLSVPPYRVRWRDIAIHVAHDNIDMRHLLTVINGGVVALCSADLSQAHHIDGDPDWPMVFESSPINTLVGLGIVRGIDMNAGELYITSCLTAEQLTHVNTVIKGADSVPAAIAMLVPVTDHPIHQPYTGRLIDAQGAFTRDTYSTQRRVSQSV